MITEHKTIIRKDRQIDRNNDDNNKEHIIIWYNFEAEVVHERKINELNINLRKVYMKTGHHMLR